MSVKRFFMVPDHPAFVSAVLLLIRLVAGTAFMMHGWSKIKHPLGWMGPDGFAPGFFQFLAAISEFGGGLAWILGLLTPLASLGIACTMTVAFSFLTFSRGVPFVAKTAGPTSELPAIYLCVALLLIGLGPGRYALDRRLFGPR
jgi:putative oxidoreductase